MNNEDGIIIKDESQIECKYALTKHVQERYAERIMSNEDLNYNLFIANHAEKIKVDINKMIHYGTCIYSGMESKDGRNSLDIYLNGAWILIVNEKEKRVITLYKVDLGAGEEFNKTYIDKMRTLIEEKKNEEEQYKLEYERTKNDYAEILERNNNSIIEHRKIIKALECENEHINALIENGNTLAKEKMYEIRTLVNRLMGVKG